MSLTPEQRDVVYATASHHLEAIAKLFKNPKITLLIRSPDLDDGDVLLTDDDFASVTASLMKTWTDDRHVVKRAKR